LPILAELKSGLKVFLQSYTIRYDRIEEFNVDSKAEYTAYTAVKS